MLSLHAFLTNWQYVTCDILLCIKLRRGVYVFLHTCVVCFASDTDSWNSILIVALLSFSTTIHTCATIHTVGITLYYTYKVDICPATVHLGLLILLCTKIHHYIVPTFSRQGLHSELYSGCMNITSMQDNIPNLCLIGTVLYYMMYVPIRNFADDLLVSPYNSAYQ